MSTNASYNQTVGAAKEAVGAAVGSEEWKQSGRAQNEEGKRQEEEEQVKQYAGGAVDRALGGAGETIAGFMGNEDAKKASKTQHDAGMINHEKAKAEILKKAEAEEAARK